MARKPPTVIPIAQVTPGTAAAIARAHAHGELVAEVAGGGLADEFGEGCEVVSRSHPEFVEVLIASIQTTWDRAEAMRPSLLRAAVAQIDAGHKAYSRMADILGASRSSTMQTRGAVA